MKQTLGAVGLAALFLTWASSANAGPLAPSKPSQLVTVTGNGSGTCNFGTQPLNQQLNPDGTITTFSVPANHVFIVTSYDASTSCTANRNTVIELVVNGLGVFSESLLTDSTGFGAKSGPVGNVVVKSGATLCGVVGCNGSAGVTVYGFLAADK